MSALILIHKPGGDIRLCIDPKPLNKALLQDHYSMSIIDDVLPLPRETKVFSSIDTSYAFWYVVPDEPKIWQRKLRECLQGLKSVIYVADDIVFGCRNTHDEAERDHDANLRALL